ncbi:MAG: DUF1801 domain-containing protein [Rheinheimera sp.]|nr:DUF1801 domain-containing protein [Rheinheimera sp.]
MPDNKTIATTEPVSAYLAAITDPQRRADCEQLQAMMQVITGCEAKMWGPGIVGFDQYHYRYDSGREGDMCITGFSSRKTDISIYLVVSSDAQQALLAQLGRHKMGKACLSVRRLSDIQLPVLQQLIAGSVVATRQRYPD